jgi:hypothetical protein
MIAVKFTIELEIGLPFLCVAPPFSDEPTAARSTRGLRGPRPVKWCARLSAPSSPGLYAAASMAITSSALSPGGLSALAIDSTLM